MDRTPRTIRRLAIVAAVTALTLAPGLTASAQTAPAMTPVTARAPADRPSSNGTPGPPRLPLPAPSHRPTTPFTSRACTP